MSKSKYNQSVCPQIMAVCNENKILYFTVPTHKWSSLSQKLASYSSYPIPGFIFFCVKRLALNHLKQVLQSLSLPRRHRTPILDNPLSQCSICILIAIKQSMPEAPGDLARPVQAQLVRKWASPTFRVPRPWDGSFASGKHSELNLPPGALWTPWRHCRYFHGAWKVKEPSCSLPT